jgi:hypothetical protein
LLKINIFRVTAGKFSASDPGKANIELDSPEFTISYKIYDNIVKQLGGTEDNLIPCNSTTDIVFRVANFDLHITPQDYLKPGGKNDEYCDFLANQGKL